MRKIWRWFFGTLLGSLVGMIFVTLFAPGDGEGFRQKLRDHYDEAMSAARKASAAKRQQLEDELHQMREGNRES